MKALTSVDAELQAVATITAAVIYHPLIISAADPGKASVEWAIELVQLTREKLDEIAVAEGNERAREMTRHKGDR